MEIMTANKQWSTRPADERYPDLMALYQATKKMADESAEAIRPISQLRVETSGDDLALLGKTSIPAHLTNWSFGQLCRRVGAQPGISNPYPQILQPRTSIMALKR